MNDASADKLSMLLSTGWFYDYWSAIGLMASESQRISIQLACRNIVKNMMSKEKVYWNVSFSGARQAMTKAELITCFVNSGGEPSLIERLKALLGDESIGSRDSVSSSMLAAITDQLVGASKLGEAFEMDVKYRVAIQGLWCRNDFDKVDFEQLCLKSNDLWDVYIRSLTPDLPMSLSDYLSGLLNTIDDRFLSLWVRLLNVMPPRDISEIRGIYLEVAQKVVDPNFMLPAWMVVSRH